MDDNLLKKGLGGIGNLGKQISKGIVEETKKSAKGAASQVTGIERADGKKEGEKQPVQPQKTEQITPEKAQSQEKTDNQDFVKMLYGKSGAQKEDLPKTPQAQAAQKIGEENPEKSAEEVQKMAHLRNQLHKETYYDPTFNRPKPKDETVQDKLEKEDEEKKMKELEVQKKEEKKKPIAVDQAERKTEAFRGVSG